MRALEPDRRGVVVRDGISLAYLRPEGSDRDMYPFSEELDVDEGWALYNEHAWRRDWKKFAEFFWSEVFVEPHSTKPFEDAVGWQLETDPETVIATAYSP